MVFQLLVEKLRRELKPKELRLFPDELVFDGEREILERTLIHNWVKQWLKWNSWFYTVACQPDPSFAELFSAPLCSTSWKRSLFDEEYKKKSMVLSGSVTTLVRALGLRDIVLPMCWAMIPGSCSIGGSWEEEVGLI